MTSFTQGAHKTQWIAVKNLSIVWASAQREFNERHADRIAGNFDPDLFDDLVVTLPNGDGVYHVVDGQHRKAAVQKLYGDEEKVPCRIVDARDPAKAASIFDRINTGRRAPSALEKFKVRVTAGAEVETAIDKLVRWLGYRVEMSAGPSCIRAVGVLTVIYRNYGAEVLKSTLVTIKGTWADDSAAVEGPILEGFAGLIAEHGNHLDWKRLREKTAAAFTPSRLLGHGKNDRELNGGRIADGIRRVLIRTYNQGLRHGKIGEKPDA